MRRDPLTRTEHRELLLERMAAQRAAMTPEQVGRLMRKVAHAALDREGSVTVTDFERANVPADAIRARGRAIILEVIQERADGGITA